MRPLFAIAWFAACAAAVPYARAATPAAPSTPDTLHVAVPGVEVTALKRPESVRDVPSATFVVSRADLARAGAARLTTVLAALPGLYAYQQNSSGDPAIIDPRGFTASGESSYLKVLLDGQDVRDAENGNVDWDWVRPEDVERVEVIQGSGAWLYGDASEGGIVNLVRAAPTRPFEYDGAVRFGSFGLVTGGLDASASSGASAVSGRLSARDVDGWRDHSRERVYGGGGEARTRLGGHELSLDVSALDADRQDPGTLNDAQLAADREQSETSTDFTHAKRLLLDIHLKSEPGSGLAWSVSPYLRGESTDQIRTLFFQPLFHHTRAWTGGGELEASTVVRPAGRRVLLQGDVQGDAARLRTEYRQFDPATGVGALASSADGSRANGSASLGARMDLADGTVARLSVRGDLTRIHVRDRQTGVTSPTRTLSAFSPLASLNQSFGEHASVYVSGSTAFRVPTLAQLYDPRPIGVPFPPFAVTISNGQLDPQRSVSAEIGGRYDGGGAQAAIAAYSSWVRNEIDFDLTSLSYANINRSWHRGIEAQASAPLPARLSARGSAAWTPTTFREKDNPDPSQRAMDGKQINGVPRGTMYGALAWSPVPVASFDLGARWVGRQFLDKLEQHPLPTFITWEAGVNGRLGRLRGTVRVLNLFDRHYSDTGFIGFDAFFQPEERTSPAAPRSVVVSLSLD